MRRYRERATGGSRHPGHHDAAALPRLIDGLARGAYEPPALDIPVVRVDTTDGYAPAFARIVALVQEHVAR